MVGEIIKQMSIIPDVQVETDEDREIIEARKYCKFFSIFDANRSEWQDRKLEYKKYLKKDYIGRENAQIFSYGSCSGAGRKYELKNQGVSVFDPVLAECLIRLFSRKGDKILDPFAGGLCRGFVASLLERKYVGIDLNEKQVKYNIERAKKFNLKDVTYICGNSLYIDRLLNRDDKFDMIFTCPPYFNLEKYSDRAEDLSNYISYGSFLKDYSTILEKSLNYLKHGKFMVIVVANFRDEEGYLVDFVGDTVKAVEVTSKARLYNEAVYINPFMSAGLRANVIFRSKKLTKVHQNILIFKKT